MPIWKTLLAATAVAITAGCSTVRLVESDVRSYTQWPESRQPGSFTFERLPSQQANPDAQAKIEKLALPALQQAGFKLAEQGTGDVTIQVGLGQTYYDRAPWDDPYPWGYGSSLFYGRGMRSGVGIGLGWSMPSPYYVFDAAVLVRDAKTQKVLYETHAKHDGRWADDPIRAALFEAAMKDFPRPAISPRRVRIEIQPNGDKAATEPASPEPAASAPAR